MDACLSGGGLRPFDVAVYSSGPCRLRSSCAEQASHGTIETPTSTSVTWHSPLRMTSTATQQCRRCLQGPSWHGKHTRSDPACVFHNSTANNGGDALAYLRRRRAATAQATTRPTGSTATTSTTGSLEEEGKQPLPKPRPRKRTRFNPQPAAFDTTVREHEDLGTPPSGLHPHLDVFDHADMTEYD